MPKPSSQSPSPFERKIKDIEREKKRVQDEIKALSRALKKGEVPPAPAPSRSRPAMAPSSVEPPPLSGAGAAAPSDGDLFSAPHQAASRSVPPSYARDRQPPVRGDERFANYFATGGFKSPLPSRKPKSVQRNKAVFIGIVTVIVIYIIIHAVVR